MRQTVVEFSVLAFGLLYAVATVLFPVVFVITSALAAFRRTRGWAGLLLYVFSYLIGAATWFLAAAICFGVFGWIGLFIGLMIVGVGVVPLGMIGGWAYIDFQVALSIFSMLVLTFIFRGTGGWLMHRADTEAQQAAGGGSTEDRSTETESGNEVDLGWR